MGFRLPVPAQTGQRPFRRGFSGPVITLTHLKGEKIVLNADLVESLEATPDTVVTLTTGKRIVVQESVPEVARKVEEYTLRRSAHTDKA